MITCSNFKNALIAMGFYENGNLYEKKYSAFNCFMRVDFDKCKLFYPPEIKGRERNNTFDAPENFVVFECVNRLLDKGYRPEHIELEKEWHLGHDAKSGRADVCVTDADNMMLFIIECKNWGREFDKALTKTKNDGGQLFSYWQQEQSCKWLVLYTSNLKDENIEYKALTFDCSDDANIVLLAKKDKSLKLYKDAHTAFSKYEVWKETYACQIYDDLVFSHESVAYQIGVKPLLKKKLRDFTPDDKIVNKFEEILRHNNVSDKENAFNRLIALFICKLVDESTKSENDEVEFQYKQGTDTYETLQDRLQRLHRDGMEKFMREEILYVSADYPEWLFSTYTGSKRNKAIENLQNTIRILKFYSNNDFAFKDVHNEELFYQNGKILVEMVQLFEKYRIVYPSKHQFLGDLFEQLLNKGFKQNEGQFFTPTPITRFVWDSLPIERMVKSERGTVYPRIIDYACGAGHFLTEAIEAINYFVQSDGNNAWARDHIYGIEKDYRLARVAKISLFMNGAGEGNIIFGDGLENVPDKGIENSTFDILVANPPYSVKDFKQHLQLKNNKFTLLDRIGLNGGEIETLFVERIGQLLKPQGIAAIILPSSILSNDSASYSGARELIIKNFYIRGIVAFGSKTFGATGTNTVIMFLEKFNEPPKQIDLSEDSIDAIFDGRDLTEWKDKDIFESYIAQIGINENIYRAFIDRKYSIDELNNVEYFKMYLISFSTSVEAKNLQKTRLYKNKSVKEQNIAYLEKFYSWAHSIEKEKILYFSLVYQQTTVVITAPEDNKKQKEFLGYDWSNRKGNEGIQIITPGGKMYNDADRTAEGTLANTIKKSFYGMIPSFDEEQKVYACVANTRNLFDFSRINFNNSIRLNLENTIGFKSRYSLEPLGKVCKVVIGGTPSRKKPEFFGGNNLWVSIAEMNGQTITDTKEKITDEAVSSSNVKLIPAGTTLLSFKLSIGKTAIAGTDLYTNEAIAALIPLDKDKLLDQYIYCLFNGKLIDLEKVENKAFGKSLNSQYLREEIKIPIPPIIIQRQIINGCHEVDMEYNNIRINIEKYRQKINDLFLELDSESQRNKLNLSNREQFIVSIGKRVLQTELVPNGKIPVYSANVVEHFGHIDKLLIKDFSVPSVLWGIDGDWMTRYMPENKEFYPTDHCGVLRCITSEVNVRYLAHLLEKEGKTIGFSRSYRASIERILGITISVPDIGRQNKNMKKVLELEQKILIEENKLKNIFERKANIVKVLLK